MGLADYVKTVWQNAVTPINETNLNKLETGLDSVNDAVRSLQLNTISELRALTSTSWSGTAYVAGYAAAGDGGGGTFYWDSASSATDDAGMVIRPNALPATGRWRRVYEGSLINVKWFGARGASWDFATQDEAGFTAALAYTNGLASGGTVFLPAGDYILAGNYTVDGNTSILGESRGLTTITHTGANWLFTSIAGATASIQHHFAHFSLWCDNSGAALGGIQHGNSYASVFEGLSIQNYLAGVGIDTHNSISWTEGTIFHNCRLAGNLYSLRFRKSGPGDKSLSDTRISDCVIMNNATGQTGILVAAGMQIYASTLDLKIMNETSGVTALEVAAGSEVIDSFMNIDLEGWTTNAADAGIGLKVASTGTIRCAGHFYLFAAAGDLVNSLTAGAKVYLDNGNRGLYYWGDASGTLFPETDPEIVLNNVTLTANRTIALSTDNVMPGMRFKVCRQATTPGAFTLAVGGLKTLAANTNGIVEVMYDGAAWKLLQ